MRRPRKARAPSPRPQQAAVEGRVRFIVCAGLLAGIALSPRLWFATSRFYPPAPLFDALGAIPLWLDSIMASAAVVLAIAAMFGSKRSLWLMTIALAILIARDQSRLQPWVFEYAVLALALSLPSRSGDDDSSVLTLATCRAVVIALFFWSGVQKLNATFVTATWREFTAPSPFGELLASLGLAVPFIELATAVALTFRATRRAGVYAAVALHGMILLILITGGENTVVWPWNLANAALALVLFGRRDERTIRITRPLLATPHAAIVFACCALPILSFWGYWDAYMSAALFSGNTIQGVILVPEDAVDRFPLVMKQNTWQESSPMFIDINRWSFDELNVPGYPAERVYKRIGEHVCRSFLPPETGALRILGRPGTVDRTRDLQTFLCAELRGDGQGRVTQTSWIPR